MAKSVIKFLYKILLSWLVNKWKEIGITTNRVTKVEREFAQYKKDMETKLTYLEKELTEIESDQKTGAGRMDKIYELIVEMIKDSK